eukprot:TRINITY_DN79388_c0_g1_i1.p1 TRINITY_DN79388_c0_g1~~TRINITY_DN79388_c0_g1_i1.p1  ORF type:complete len:338 (+),score=67.45 TRINITY_DN79388_c0_g1_i1:82-1014(+)
MFIATPGTVQGAGSLACFGFCARLQSLIGCFLSFVSLITTSWLQSSLLQEERNPGKHPELTATAKAQEEDKAAAKITETCATLVANMEGKEGLQQEPKLVDAAESQDIGPKESRIPEAAEQQEPEFVDTAARQDVGPKESVCLEAEEHQEPKFTHMAKSQDVRPKELRHLVTVELQNSSVDNETVATSAFPPSFADMLRNQQAREPGSDRNPGGGCLPPSHGYRFAPQVPAAGTARQRRRVVATSCLSNWKQNAPEDDDGLDSTAGFSASHGWSKQHKASRNAKLQRKVDWSKQRRAEQSRASRFCEEDE